MTLEQLNERIDTIDECYDILIDTFLEIGIERPYVNDVTEILDILRDRYRKLRDSAWVEMTHELDELSKQA